MLASSAVLSWVHFGDLHITGPGRANYRDFLALISIANRDLAGHLDFALLPGDNADDGSAAQFALVREAIDRLAIPVHILPGDHDFHTRSLDPFHNVLNAAPLPYAATVAGVRCLFLDIVSAGTGGPDFRLDDAQLEWVAHELAQAERTGTRAAVFMHAYPADLRHGADRLRALLARHHVTCVDMGHTHYNELSNDGRTIFMATRSTGQVEEGPVGFSVAAIDAGVVSWRFVPRAEPGPIVLITSPADHRLIVDPGSGDQVVRAKLRVQAKIWTGHGVRGATARIDDGGPVQLTRTVDDVSLWHAPHLLGSIADGLHRLTVRAEDEAGITGSDAVTFLVDRAGRYEPPTRHADGSDRDAVGAWPEKGILGTQLGPNRNGRKW